MIPAAAGGARPRGGRRSDRRRRADRTLPPHFHDRTTPQGPPDYYDVLLHKLVGGTLTTERIYTVINPELRIDPSVLVGGAEYVFEIRSFKGQPLASHGDFTFVQFPYGSAVVFTRTFKTS